MATKEVAATKEVEGGDRMTAPTTPCPSSLPLLFDPNVSYKGVCSIIVGSVSSKIVDAMIQSRSLQSSVSLLAGLVAAKTFYTFLSGRGDEALSKECVPGSYTKVDVVAESSSLCLSNKTGESEMADIVPDGSSNSTDSQGEEKKDDDSSTLDGRDLVDTPNKISSARSLAGHETDWNKVRSGISVVSAPVHMLSPEARGRRLAQERNEESEKLLFLRKEVAKLKNQNTRLTTDIEFFKDSNQRLREANTTAGESFAVLNQHIQQLSKANEKIASELSAYKQQVQKLNMSHVEMKEELKMKQATYGAEVQSRLQYEKLLASIVDSLQERCRDTKLVEEILRKTDALEQEQLSRSTVEVHMGPRITTPPAPPRKVFDSTSSVVSP